jgi:hypothetical protein
LIHHHLSSPNEPLRLLPRIAKVTFDKEKIKALFGHEEGESFEF